MGWIKHQLLICTILHITGWSLSKGACVLSDRIKRNDSEVTVSQTDQPCTLILTARNNKQVVVVMYDTVADCVKKATVAIYDGTSTSGTLLTNKCQANPWSFASRAHSLTLTPEPGKPLRPFSLDIHSFDSIQNYTESRGIIRSERYRGYVQGAFANLTPNNFHAFYNILLDENVTISIHFKELQVQQDTSEAGKKCKDYIRIHEIASLDKMCNQDVNLLHPNVTTLANEVSVEFTTDALDTYSGFELEYNACFDKRQESNRTQYFELPTYQLMQDMRCFLDIRFWKGTRIIISMTIYSNMIGRDCKDIIRIVATDRDVTDESLKNCTLNTTIIVEFMKYDLLRIILTSQSQYEFVKGNYTTEPFTDETTASSFSDSPFSEVLTSNILTEGNMTSFGKDINNADTSTGRISLMSTNYTTIIVIVAVGSMAVVVSVIIALIVARRKLGTANKKGTVKNYEFKGGNKFKADPDKGGIYEDNDVYDIVRTKRKHKATPQECNIYSGTYGSSAEYAVVKRTGEPTKPESSDEYDDHKFEVVYDKTERHTKIPIDDDIYE